MAEGFANSIIGGAETLIRSAIKSVNFVLGASGWIITREGDAEFNDATIRGTLTTGSAPGVVISTNDPLLVDLSQEAGIVYYYAPDKAFIQSVEQSGLSAGQWHFWGYDPARLAQPLTQYIDMLYDNADPSGDSVSIGVNGSGGQAATASFNAIGLLVITADDRTRVEGPLYSGTIPVIRGQKDIESVTVPNGVTSFAKNIVFPTPFASGVQPHVTANILSAAGPTARWVERCINVTNVGFTLFLFSGNVSVTPGFTSDVSWSAVEEAL